MRKPKEPGLERIKGYLEGATLYLKNANTAAGRAKYEAYKEILSYINNYYEGLNQSVDEMVAGLTKAGEDGRYYSQKIADLENLHDEQ